jgi:Fe-S-cluster containining protein
VADQLTDDLCTRCGLCCNGVLFTDTRCADDEEAERIVALGIDLIPGQVMPSFQQPCCKLSSTRCQIYSDRPRQCQAFECELLKRTRQGERDLEGALKIVADTQGRAGEIRSLLAKLGDHAEDRPLAHRFESVRQLANDEIEDWWDDYARLTLEVNALQAELKAEFYRVAEE